jgi:hypothetical protein
MEQEEEGTERREEPLSPSFRPSIAFKIIINESLDGDSL